MEGKTEIGLRMQKRRPVGRRFQSLFDEFDCVLNLIAGQFQQGPDVICE
jgi:hypothetical protein